jgi:hypothetical protein
VVQFRLNNTGSIAMTHPSFGWYANIASCKTEALIHDFLHRWYTPVDAKLKMQAVGFRESPLVTFDESFTVGYRCWYHCLSTSKEISGTGGAPGWCGTDSFVPGSASSIR